MLLWIIGAPTFKTIEDIKSRLPQQPKIVICGDLNEYSKVDGWLGSSPPELLDVYTLPTNFRNHTNKFGDKYVKLGKTTIKDNQTFKEAQEETALALAELFNICKMNNIPTYFANVARKNRSTYLVQDIEGKYGEKNRIIATDSKYNGEIIKGARKDISQLVLENLMNYKIDDNSHTAILYREWLETQMLISSAYSATYLADVLTVACMMANNDCWIPYNLVEPSHVNYDGTYPKKGILTDNLTCVPYTRAKFIPSPSQLGCPGNFFKFDQSKFDLINETLVKCLTSQYPLKIFTKSIIYHDSWLNDVDDMPAIELIKKLSIDTPIEIINYELI